MTLIEARAAPLGDETSRVEGTTPHAPSVPGPRRAIEDVSVPLRTMMDAAIDGLILIDHRGTVLTLNAPAVAMFGYKPDELIGRNVSMLMPEPDRSRHDGYLSDYLATGKARILGIGREVGAMRKDGTVFAIDLGISEIDVGSRRLFLGVTRDITGRKRAESEKEERFVTELTRSNAELARFAYVASHDLQEPLRMIGSYLELLSNRYGDKLDSDAQEFIAFAVDGAARMKRLITDLLNYSRVGSAELSLETVDVGELVASVVDSLRLMLAESGGKVDVGDLPQLVVDPGQLTRVFQNLIENAIKYRADAPPAIEISARRAGRYWRFDVVDNGIGIDPRFVHKVFEIFQRLHGRDAYQGTGIGLAAARLAVERHGGTIWVEPLAGGGSRFSFTIPERST